MADPKAKEVLKDWERGESIRGQWLSHAQQVTNYIHPDRADYTVTRSPGQKRMQYVYDSHPIWCREQFAAGCHSFLTSSTILWFSLAADNERINAMHHVREWLDAATLAMFAVYNSARYNFAVGSQEVYDDVASIGTACMAVLENPRTGMPMFSTRHMKECVFFEGENDRVDTVVRRWEWTAAQAYKFWGVAAGERVMKAMQTGRETDKFAFLHRVKPRLNRDPQRADRLHMAFESVYVAEADQAVVRESGFRDFPYLTPRGAKAPNETYGRGRGHTALPDVKMLNEAQKLVWKAAQKVVDPVLDMPDEGYLLPIKTVPGGIIFHRPGLRPDDRARPIETHGDIPIGREMINELRNAIGRVFFVDLLRMPQDPQDPASEGKGITATYWLQRRQKDMMALSPFLSRMNAEWSGPNIDRVFAILWRKSQAMGFGPGAPFPPPPQELSGQALHPEYVSPIAMAQRTSELDSIQAMIDRQLQIRQIDPQSPIYLDFDFIMRRTQRDTAAPAGAVKAPETLEEEAQAKAEAEAALNNQAALGTAARAMKDGGEGMRSLAEAGAGGMMGQMEEAA